VLVGAALLCTVCQPALDTETRLALLEGQARDTAAHIDDLTLRLDATNENLLVYQRVADEMRCQLIEFQKGHQALLETTADAVGDLHARLKALESVESRIQGFPAALCEPEEVRQ
jgi:hypothetical protein